MPKSLLKHVDKHKEDGAEGTADQNKTTTKIKRNKGERTVITTLHFGVTLQIILVHPMCYNCG